MKQSTFTFLLVLMLLVLRAAPCLADEAQSSFDSLYGDELKRVRATSDSKDDIDLAERMIEAANTTRSEPLAAILCNNAYDLADRRQAHATAAQAMRVLLEKVPRSGEEVRDKLGASLRKQYNSSRGDARTAAGEQLIESLIADAQVHAARERFAEAVAALRSALPIAISTKSPMQDSVKAQLDAMTGRQQIAMQISRLRERLLQAPDNGAANGDLARLLLIELDQPDKAKPYALKSDQEPWRQFAPLVAEAPQTLTTTRCVEVASWLRSLAAEPGVSATGKRHVLLRAREYLKLVQDAKDATRLNLEVAKLALTSVNEDLAKLPDPESGEAGGDNSKTSAGTKAAAFGKVRKLDVSRDIKPEDGAMDLLSFAKEKHELNRGTWTRQGNRLIGQRTAESEAAYAILPFMPESTDYEMELKFERLRGNDAPSAGLLVPLPTHDVWAVICAPPKEISGFDKIDGKALNDNAFGNARIRLELNRVYTTHYRVIVEGNKGSIVVSLEGKKIMEWSGNVTSLNRKPGPSLPMAICTHGNCAFHELAIKVHNGKVIAFEAP